jgi:hypothetical protein
MSHIPRATSSLQAKALSALTRSSAITIKARVMANYFLILRYNICVGQPVNDFVPRRRGTPSSPAVVLPETAPMLRIQRARRSGASSGKPEQAASSDCAIRDRRVLFSRAIE